MTVSVEIKDLLEQKVAQFNQVGFIPDDPISIPHRFSLAQDIEIMGFFAAVLAWGLRKTIINKCSALLELMDGAPYDFILHHQPQDLKRFEDFKHRTFNATDTLYFIEFLRTHYTRFDSLEDAFLISADREASTIESHLIGFHNYFFSLPVFPERTRKHIATPARKSTCKRLSMYLRWMVRTDNAGVDFGLWERITPNQLICPMDVHVERVSRNLGLISRKQRDWQTALELTLALSRRLDPSDPVKYDFALFGMGLEMKNV